MKFSKNMRTLLGVGLISLLAACGPLAEGNTRHLQPLSSSTVSALKTMGSSEGAGMMVRLFKEESVLEVWKEVGGGTYKLFRSYEICAYSGEFGPKKAEGDRQAPEGFYTITPGLMNPNSNFYLAFNLGFPNKFDRAYGRTGSHLMVHGACSSRGCYSMTDEQIAEIYALARETFEGGNRSFQFQAYPFRMTGENMARFHNSEHLDFWRNIKTGYDHFEVTKRPPVWDVCAQQYVFNATAENGQPLNARAACPTLERDPSIEALVASRQTQGNQAFEAKVASLLENEANRVEQARRAEETRIATAEREAAIAEQMDGIGQSVGNFFGGLFGQEPVSATPVDLTAPTIADANAPTPEAAPSR